MSSQIASAGSSAGTTEEKPQAQKPAEYLFMSSHCGIRARGIFEQLQRPVKADKRSSQYSAERCVDTNGFSHIAENSENKNHFHRQLQNAFVRARKAGIANPIAIGAIPFDQSQPAQLAIPRSYEIFSRELESGAANSTPADTPSRKVLHSLSTPAEARFKQAVRQAIANFQLSDIRKAVLSRVLELELDGPLDLDAFFQHLLAQNPAGYQFRVPLADGAELIGASPELLLRRQGAEVFTNPLAGSARRQKDAALDKKVSEQLTQSSKDAYEHRLVVEDIRNQLAPVCRELAVPDVPQLMHTRAMWHLSTPIRGTLADPSMTALQVACRLHPTPALCGFPTRDAHKLIQLVEPFERGMFGGIVGWCDAEGNGEWAVAIRCGIFAGKRAQLFAGAGIVEDSDPDSEWQETRAKLRTMLNALGVDPELEGSSQSAQEKQAAAPDEPGEVAGKKVAHATRLHPAPKTEVQA